MTTNMIHVKGGWILLGDKFQLGQVNTSTARWFYTPDFKMDEKMVGKTFFDVFKKETKHDSKAGTSQYEGNVAEVNLFDAMAYANWVSEREGREPYYYDIDVEKCTWKCRTDQPARLPWEKRGYRLPSSGMFEYAAKGGQLTVYHPYAGTDDHNKLGPGFKNELGIADMSKVLFQLTDQVHDSAQEQSDIAQFNEFWKKLKAAAGVN